MLGTPELRPLSFGSRHAANESSKSDLSGFIDAFESARACGPADLGDFLPPSHDRRRLPVLVELIRIDLERGWTEQQPTPLLQYQRRYPEAFRERTARQQLVFEDYRQRAQAGNDPCPAQFQREFDISVQDWPTPEQIRGASVGAGKATQNATIRDPLGMGAAARAYQEFRKEPGAEIKEWSPAADDGATRLFNDLHQRNPEAALRLADAASGMPSAGAEFAGFRLLAELGRGAFGRVFLAEQKELAGRHVVLKVSVDIATEVEALSQLLHTNIVPIYSIHRSGPNQAVCMPYCGTTTLADAIRRFRGETVPQSGKGIVTILNSSAPGQRLHPLQSGDPEPARQASSTVVLKLLEEFTYVEAVLWIGARLADALTHAHERGILHRDLKPANVLLTDEGQPMLLDFNLSADTKLTGIAEAARLGGTLPYMPPEHLESFAGERRLVDARGDVYALGVILYELLTVQLPFPNYGRANRDIIVRMVNDRRHTPSLRERNPEVSPAVESIVRKCLEFDPKDRYQSAQELMQDLERQLHHQPLKFAPNRSMVERARKWSIRHPRLSSWFTIGTCACVLIAAITSFAIYQRQRHLGLEARENLGAFRDDSMRFQLSLTGLPEDDRKPMVDAVANGRLALGRYPSPDDPDWADAGSVKHLSAGDRQQLREEIGTLLLMLAHATARANGDERAASEALRLNEQAERCFPADAKPSALLSQRAELVERLNRPDEARALRSRVSDRPSTSRGLYLEGWEHARQGRYDRAVPLLEESVRKDPQALWAWFLLGRSYDGLGRDADAVACYSTCLALKPDAHQVWFNRALAQLRRGDFKNAQADFDQAIELKPNVADAYFNRALARKALGDWPGAEADLDLALELGTELTRVYFVRAEVRAKRGNLEGAESDRQEGLQREPIEESCWNARGYAKLESDPKDALADFDQALERNPRYLPALLNKSHVLADLLNRPADAVAVLDTAIRYHPLQAQLWAGRAVYLARLGKREQAHRNAEQALQMSGDPATRYQVAGVYALTSKDHPEDRPEAFRLLAWALKRDYGFEYLDIDPELAPVRDLAEFKELVNAARALKSTMAK